MTKQSNIEKLIEDFTKAQEEIRVKLEAELKKTFKAFFEETGVTAVIWSQYSPYFNDGDECVFSVHAPVFTNAPLDDLENVSAWGEYEGEDESVWLYGEDVYGYDDPAEGAVVPQEIIPALDALSKLIQNSALEDIFKALFNNHVKVTATAEGFATEEYSHD